MGTTAELKESMELLKRQQAEWRRSEKKLEKSVQNAPEGNITMKRCRGKYPQYYYSDEQTKEQYLGAKDNRRIQALLQKKYDEKYLRELKKNLAVLNKFINSFHPEFPELIRKSFQAEQLERIRTVQLDDREYVKQWKEALERRREGNPSSYPLSGEIFTDQGETVRSKSEKIIADKLLKFNIPYVYEVPLELKGYGTVYPDFTVLDVDKRKTVYLEHFGRMDDEQYCQKTIKKIIAYEKNGIRAGKELLYTFETSEFPLNIEYLELLIRNNLPDSCNRAEKC